MTDPEWVFPFELCGQEEVQALFVATALLRDELVGVAEAMMKRLTR